MNRRAFVAGAARRAARRRGAAARAPWCNWLSSRCSRV